MASDDNPFGVPPEVMAAMRAQAEAQHASNEANLQRQDNFIEGLDEEQLRIMRGFMKAVLDDRDFGTYMMGWISSILKYKFKVCQYCGDKHLTLEDMIAAHPEDGAR